MAEVKTLYYQLTPAAWATAQSTGYLPRQRRGDKDHTYYNDLCSAITEVYEGVQGRKSDGTWGLIHSVARKVVIQVTWDVSDALEVKYQASFGTVYTVPGPIPISACQVLTEDIFAHTGCPSHEY